MNPVPKYVITAHPTEVSSATAPLISYKTIT